MAQGGTQVGYALYVKDGHLEMAMRKGGKLTSVTAPNALPTGPLTLRGSIALDGTLRLEIAGAVVAMQKASGPLQTMPVDGLQVGRDLGGLVGEYGEENAFAGTLEKVRIELKE